MNEAECLFTEALDCDRLSLYLNRGIRIDKQRSAFISSALRRRIFNEPLQYILGKAEFMGMEFKVNKDALIPRPETEILVETAIRLTSKPQAQSYKLQAYTGLSILDIGTGCGCIAVSLAKFLPGAQISATDISVSALGIAAENARLNKVKINFTRSDLFSFCRLLPLNYDLIISNPPYVPSGLIKELQPEISYEPAVALDGGSDGLNYYRRIIPEAPIHLKENGLLIIEIGFNQRAQVEEIIEACGHFEIVETAKDYNNISRVVAAKKVR